MLLEQTKGIINDEYGGVPDFYISKQLPYNMLWGTDYIVFFDGLPSENDIEHLVEGMLSLREFNRLVSLGF